MVATGLLGAGRALAGWLRNTGCEDVRLLLQGTTTAKDRAPRD